MKLEDLKSESRNLTLVVCAGFEERAVTATSRFVDAQILLQNFALIKFGGPENKANEAKLTNLASDICNPDGFYEYGLDELSEFQLFLGSLNRRDDVVVFDITGCSRSVMLVILSKIYDTGLEFDIIYTEAEDYYPTFRDYEELAEDDDAQHAFFRLNRFEESEVLHSSHCTVEGFEEFPGRMLPNYPFFLMTFLPFKRGRLSAILQNLESEVRVFIRGQPIRDDLKWRGEAVEIPNADLIDEGKVVDLETLDWRKTYSFLESQYFHDDNRFRYNFVVAPLGSKMQTVGCFLFAKTHSEVKIITSTPKHHYPNSYSIGFGETFLFRAVHVSA